MNRDSSSKSAHRPLAEVMRPRSLAELVVEADSPLAALIQRVKAGRPIQSLLLQGPPGVGKTTIARLLGISHDGPFFELRGASAGVKELRALLQDVGGGSKDELFPAKAPLIFIDEIHRFNRTQQDFLLPFIEAGEMICVCATTENPSFALSPALLSRLYVIELHSMSQAASVQVLTGRLPEIAPQVAELIAKAAYGDARRMWHLVEDIGEPLSTERVTEYLERGGISLQYDEELHYQIISAMIKSVRASDADAGLYWAFRLLESGCDPKFLFRRLIIFASEDIGNADPRALTIALDGDRAFERVGLPEGKIPLAQVITYLAGAPKSRSSYVALQKVLEAVRLYPRTAVPPHLKNAQAVGAKQKAGGQSATTDSANLPAEVKGAPFYNPSDRGYEMRMKERWTWLATSNDSKKTER